MVNTVSSRKSLGGITSNTWCALFIVSIQKSAAKSKHVLNGESKLTSACV